MSCVFQAHRIMIDFFPIPYSFNTMLKPVSLSCGHSGCLVCLKQLNKSTANPKCPMYVSEGISGINYFCQYRPQAHYNRICCGVRKSRMWLEGEICKGTSSPKTLPPAACEMCKRGMRISWGSRKNAAARKILQQEGDPLQRLWWSDSVGFVAGAAVYKRHKTVSLRQRGNISQVTMLLILVTLLRCSQYCRLSKEKWTAFSRTRAR